MKLSTPTRISTTIEGNQIPHRNMRIRKKNLKLDALIIEEPIIIRLIVHFLRRTKEKANKRSISSLEEHMSFGKVIVNP